MFSIDYDDVKTKVLNNENALKNISLYSVTGKFSFYFIIESFDISRYNMIEFRIQPTISPKVAVHVINMKSYIYDAFDFNDTSNQSVGVWDYINMNFDILHSMKETAYQHDNKANWFVNVTLDYERAKDKMYIYNYHYQNYKKSVNKGFDYRIFSDSFIEFKDEHFFIDLLYDVNGAK